jgi:Rrf2 family protein
MLRLSTRSRYGLRAVVDIAAQSDGKPVQVSQIARRQNVSPRYIEQIFQKLKPAGIIATVRGPKGGYLLGRPAQEISIMDILDAVEGPLILSPCLGGEFRCRAVEQCLTQRVWGKAQGLLSDYLGATTIADVLKELSEDPAPAARSAKRP